MSDSGIFRQRLIKPEESQKVTLWKPLFGVLLGFLLIRSLLAAIFPLSLRQQQVEWVGSTQQAFSEVEDQIDVLFLGSSRIYRGVNPEIIQEDSIAHSTPITVFNHAWPNMTLLEIQSIIRDSSLQDIDFVLFEPSMHSQWVVNNPDSMRAHTFFTPRNTLEHLQYLSCAGFPKKLSLESAYHATMAMLSSLFGRGFLQQYSTMNTERTTAPALGHRSLDQETKDSFLERELQFKEQRKQYNKKRKRLLRKPSKPPSSCQIEAIQDTVALIRSKGSEPIILFPPTVRMAKEYNGLAERIIQLDVQYLIYDIDTVPELYAPQLRYDEEHLNAAGAAVWSRLLADDLMRIRED